MTVVLPFHASPTFLAPARAPSAALRQSIYRVLCVGISLGPVADFLSVWAGGGVAGAGARVSLLLRAAVTVALFGLLLSRGRLSREGLRLACAALYCVVVAAWLWADSVYAAGALFEQMVFVVKVFSVFVYGAAMATLDPREFRVVGVLGGVTLAVYAAAILAGAGLSIDMFRSYQADVQIRSGYKGIFVAQNEVSALMAVALATAYLLVLRGGWSAYRAAFVGVVVLASMCVGTKAAIGNVALMTLAYLVAQRGWHGAVLPALAILLVGLAVMFSAYGLVPSVREAADVTLAYFTDRYQPGNADSVVGMVASGRNVKLLEVWQTLAQSTWLPLLVGGYPAASYLVEMDFPDLAIVLGLPVLTIYLVAWCAPFLTRTIPVTHRHDLYGRLVLVILLLLANLAGHVLASGGVALYLALLGQTLRRGARGEV